MAHEVTAVLPQALQGWGGVGKTQLAIEYAYRHAADYDVIWWIPADQPVLVRSGLAALAPRLRLADIAPERVEDAVRAVLESLRRGDPYARWLLIFDNADDPEAIRDLLPSGPIRTVGDSTEIRGDVLVTSRNHLWKGVVETVEVDVFSRSESLEFLTRRVPGGDEVAFEQLAEELGDLPLALEQAGALQAETGMSVAEYLELLHEESRKLLAENSPLDYPWPVAAAWSLSVAKLRDRMPQALELLRCCAFFGPEPIPRDLLQRGRYVLDSPLRMALGDKILTSRCMRELGRYALARIDNSRNTLQVHRLIQKLLRDELPEGKAATVRHDVHLLLAAADPGEPESIKNWPAYQELMAHFGPSAVIECTDSEVRQLVKNVYRYLYEVGDYTNCRDGIDRTLEYWTLGSSSDDRQVMELRGLKAWVWWAMGRYASAGEIRRSVLEQAKESLGPNHEFTLDTRNGYGADLRAGGDFKAAMELDEDLLEKHRKVFGRDHPMTLMVANNLAVDCCLNGQYRRAYELDVRCHQDRLDHFGQNDHPWVLASLGAIARDLRLAGHYQEALDIARRAWLLFKDVTKQRRFPKRHPFVLLQAKDYSITLRSVGQTGEALALAEGVYRKYCETFKSDHPDALAAAVNLANAMRSAGNFEGAAERIEDSARRYREIWGAAHPFTYGCLLDLAIVWRSMNRSREASELLERVYVGLCRSVGSDHHYTLMCLANLAVTIAELGDVDKSIELGNEAVDGLQGLLGAGHPHVLTSRVNLAMSMRDVGTIKEGKITDEEGRAGLVDLLGADHPDVRSMQCGGRLVFDIDPHPV